MGFFSKKVFKNNNENTSEQEAQKRVNEDGSEWMQFADTLILAAAAKIRALKRIEEDEKLPKELKDILKTLMENL